MYNPFRAKEKRLPQDSKSGNYVNIALAKHGTSASSANLSDQQLYVLLHYIDTLEERITKLEAKPAPAPAHAPNMPHREVGTFGDALHYLNAGKRVARAGWVQWNTYIWLMPPASVPIEHIKEPHLKELCGEKESIDVHGCIRMLTYDGKVMTGWVPNQADMQATDWVVVE